MKKRKTTRSAADGRAKQTEGYSRKAKSKNPKNAGGRPASTPRKTAQRLSGKPSRNATG